jgi:hypothetical protein
MRYRDIAVRFDVVHPEVRDGACLCEKIFYGLQGERAHKIAYQQRVGRLAGGRRHGCADAMRGQTMVVSTPQGDTKKR